MHQASPRRGRVGCDKASLGQFQQTGSGKTYLVVAIKLENGDNSTHSYNPFDFRVQTASGQVLDQTMNLGSTELNSGDLVACGNLTGTVSFELPQEAGHQYLIYKPNAFMADRVIVQAK